MRLPGCERVLFDSRWERVGCDVCHIFGAEPGGPRYDSDVPVDYLRSYENLLLLCKSCHHHVDYERPSDFQSSDSSRSRPLRSVRANEPFRSNSSTSLSMSSACLSMSSSPKHSVPTTVPPWRWSPLIDALERELDDGLAIHRVTARAVLEAEYGGGDFEYEPVGQLDSDDIAATLATLRQAQAIGDADRPFLADDERTLAELNEADRPRRR